jgi:hypothetical protein
MRMHIPIRAAERRLAVLAMLIMLSSHPAQAQRSPLWCGLEGGPYAVGFETLERMEQDFSVARDLAYTPEEKGATR